MIDLFVALGLSAFLIVFALWKRALTLPAVLLASALLICISLCAGWIYAAYLTVVYALLAAIDAIVKDRADRHTDGVLKKSSARGVVQILANGGFAVIAVIAYATVKHPALLYAYLICVAETCADSIASDVGVLSKRKPVSIITFREVETGLSGGISALGMLSSLGMCIFCGILGCICVGFSVRNIIILTLVPFTGMILDSILGATVQIKKRCAVCGKNTELAEHCSVQTVKVGGVSFITNTIVNAVCNLVCGIAGFILSSLII